MKGYAATSIFRPEEIELWERATRMVACVLDPVPCYPRMAEVRCHELARAVAQKLSVPSVADGTYGPVDGTYGPVDHSWIVLYRDGIWSRALPILDVYAVGRLPMVQLVDGGILSGNGALYTKRKKRDDVDFELVSALVQEMSWEPPPGMCVHCGKPLGGVTVGAGDGTGQRFAHKECADAAKVSP